MQNPKSVYITLYRQINSKVRGFRICESLCYFSAFYSKQLENHYSCNTNNTSYHIKQLCAFFSYNPDKEQNYHYHRLDERIICHACCNYGIFKHKTQCVRYFSKRHKSTAFRLFFYELNRMNKRDKNNSKNNKTEE